MALELFAPIARDYQLWSRVLGFGQDPRWRKMMVRDLDLRPGARILDVAAGTGEVTRLLTSRDLEVYSLDQSPDMLSQCAAQGGIAIQGRAESLPFPDNSFDGLTFTYLLRYVDDVPGCMQELVRVLKPQGLIGMVEFGLPTGFPWVVWWLYTRTFFPLVGGLIGPGWRRVGTFLGPSIDEFHRRFPVERLVKIWESAGLEQVKLKRPTLGAGLVMWGRKISR